MYLFCCVHTFPHGAVAVVVLADAAAAASFVVPRRSICEMYVNLYVVRCLGMFDFGWRSFNRPTPGRPPVYKQTKGLMLCTVSKLKKIKPGQLGICMVPLLPRPRWPPLWRSSARPRGSLTWPRPGWRGKPGRLRPPRPIRRTKKRIPKGCCTGQGRPSCRSRYQRWQTQARLKLME